MICDACHPHVGSYESRYNHIVSVYMGISTDSSVGSGGDSAHCFHKSHLIQLVAIQPAIIELCLQIHCLMC